MFTLPWLAMVHGAKWGLAGGIVGVIVGATVAYKLAKPSTLSDPVLQAGKEVGLGTSFMLANKRKK